MKTKADLGEGGIVGGRRRRQGGGGGAKVVILGGLGIDNWEVMNNYS